MRDFIAERLAEMKNPDERAILKEVLSNVFLPLYDETEAKYAALEQRVRDEVPLLYDNYTVYSTVLPHDQVDNKHVYLSAMIPVEAGVPILSTRDLTDVLQDGGHPVIETVFVEADHRKCLQISRDKRILSGSLYVKGEQCPFKCVLRTGIHKLENAG